MLLKYNWGVLLKEDINDVPQCYIGATNENLRGPVIKCNGTRDNYTQRNGYNQVRISLLF